VNKRVFYSIGYPFAEIKSADFSGSNKNSIIANYTGATLRSWTISARYLVVEFASNSNGQMLKCLLHNSSVSNCEEIGNFYQQTHKLASDYFNLYYTAPGLTNLYTIQYVEFFDINDSEFNTKTAVTGPYSIDAMTASNSVLAYYTGMSVKVMKKFTDTPFVLQETVNQCTAFALDSKGEILFWSARGINTYIVKACTLTNRSCKIIYKDSARVLSIAIFN